MHKYQIDPANITNYDLSQAELELVLSFWIFPAGKNAQTSARGLERFMQKMDELYLTLFGRKTRMSPFHLIRYLESCRPCHLGRKPRPNWISGLMKRCGIGCYVNKAHTLLSLVKANLDLQTCSLEDLEGVWGIGAKTARCFLIHSRRNQEYAGLDTHLLRYLRDQGIDAPLSTPSKKKYRKLELEFLKLAKASGESVADFDLRIWRQYSGN